MLENHVQFKKEPEVLEFRTGSRLKSLNQIELMFWHFLRQNEADYSQNNYCLSFQRLRSHLKETTTLKQPAALTCSLSLGTVSEKYFMFTFRLWHRDHVLSVSHTL